MNGTDLVIRLWWCGSLKGFISPFRGEAPLHYAVRLGRKDVVSQLLCAGASIEIKGNMLELAVESRHNEIAAHLNRVHGTTPFPLLSCLKRSLPSHAQNFWIGLR